MPAYLTHNYFGQDVLAQLPNIIAQGSVRAKQAFLLGCQGPDPLFYAPISPKIRHNRRFGTTMHSRCVAETMQAFRDAGGDDAVGKAYTLGFICHYSLDSTMHPFVYAQQYAICAAGVPGLDKRDGSAVHIQMESDLDMMMLAQRHGRANKTYNFTKGALSLDDDGLMVIDELYGQMARRVYDIELDAAQFSTGVKNMRLAMRFLFSPRGIKRTALGYMERIFRRHSTLQALSYRMGIGISCDFDNHEGREWKNPFNEQVSHNSFAELYDHALQVAAYNIEKFLAGKPCVDISGGINFNGDREPY